MENEKRTHYDRKFKTTQDLFNFLTIQYSSRPTNVAKSSATERRERDLNKAEILASRCK